MPTTQPGKMPRDPDLDRVLRNCEALNLVDASIAVVDARGELVFQNNAFARLNESTRDPANNFAARGSLIDSPQVRELITRTMAAGAESLSRQEIFYGPKMKVELTLRVRPITKASTSSVVGATITIGEESIDFDNRHLARRQESHRTLVERVRELSVEKLSNDRLIRMLLKDTPFAMALLNEKRQILQLNRAAEHLFGASERELRGRTCDVILSCYQACGSCPVQASGTRIELDETSGTTTGKQSIPLLRSAALLDDRKGTLILEAFIDLSERKKTEDALARLGRIVDSSSNEIYSFRADSLQILQANLGAQRSLGYTLDELSSLTPLELLPDFTRESFDALLAPLRNGEKRELTFESTHKRKNGYRYPVEVWLQYFHDETAAEFFAITQDITERRQSQLQLQHLAHHDNLTGLPNRMLMQDHLVRVMAEAERRERLVAVLFLDLDRFKTINDTLGHDSGDALLKGVAERLQTCLRAGDFVARLGGDEFTVVLANVAHVDDVTHVAQKILDQLATPFLIGGRELVASPSIGITLYPLDEMDAQSLLRNADTAMYRAKEMGGNRFQFCTAELNALAARRLQLETSLRGALERQELVLHYQPLVDIRTGRIRGMEALIRWQHPEYGLIPPQDFIPLAEETGLIIPIGEWVLATACAQIKAWHNAGFPSLQVAVNLSSKQLRDINLIAVVTRALDAAGLAPHFLDLELTESVLMQDMEQAAEILKGLKTVGTSFSLDDFGTGYSSLSYLKRFPIDYLKIDRSFIRDINSDTVGAGIVKAIIAMAGVLDMKVIAEGVETYEQLVFLRGHGCDYTQGHYCSRPLSSDEFTQMLQDWDQTRAARCGAGSR